MGSTEKEGRSRSEKPQHLVTVEPFLMSKYPVTCERYFMVANLPKVECELSKAPPSIEYAKFPVTAVSWYEANEFCERLRRRTGLQYRLPTEAEWEYACRAGTRTKFYFGETISADVVNLDFGSRFFGLHSGGVTAVGRFPPNDFGLYDMHGNVWEWCIDYWTEDYEGAPDRSSPDALERALDQPDGPLVNGQYRVAVWK